MPNAIQWQVFPRKPGDDDLEGFAAELVHGLPIRIALDGERWGSEAWDIIASLKPGLEMNFLSVRGSMIGDQGMKALAKCPALSFVHYLGLERCGISDDVVRTLIQSGRFENLKTLSLCNRDGLETGPLNTVGDPGAGALASTFNLPVLEELDLWNTQVGDRGFQAIASSARLTELNTVYAWGTKLTASGAKRVKDIAAEKSRAREAAGLRPFRWTTYHTNWDDRTISWSEVPG